MVEFEIVRGTTFEIEVDYLDSENQPIDLTGYEAAMQLRLSPGEVGPPLFQINTVPTPNGSRIAIEFLGGIINIKITDEDTATFRFKRAVFDLVVFAPNGDKEQLFEGVLIVKPPITV